jgi:co-chaperonin GroES (HSP10)
MFYDPKAIRVKDGWCIVLMDERKVQLDSGIILAVETGAEKVTEGSGLLIRVGAGKKTAALEIEAGQRICCRSYLKYANPIPTEETWPSGSKKEYFIMSADDIMGVLSDGVNVGVFTSPANRIKESV